MSLFPENVRLKPVALPTEHGGWGFILEPILLGLAVAPSWTGLLVGMGAVAGFLFRQPIKIIWGDFSAARNTARTHAALVFGGIYFLAASICFAAAFTDNSTIAVPLVFALPLGGIVLFFDSRKQSRTLIPEILGPVALGSTGAAVMIAGGQSIAMGFVIWALAVGRSLPSIFYVRARLRLEYGKNPDLRLPIATHLAAIAGALALGIAGVVPYLVSLVYVVMLVRAALGLSRIRRKLSAQAVGFSEIAWGLFAVALLSILLTL